MNSVVYQSLIDELVYKILNDYKIEEPVLRNTVQQSLQRNKKLLDLIEKESDIKRIQRTRIYSDFSVAIKKSVYKDLRQYYQNKDIITDVLKEAPDTSADSFVDPSFLDNLLLSHVSTRERIAESEQIYNCIFPYLPPSSNLVDIGSGIHPLLLYSKAQEFARSLRHYFAADKDATSIDIINRYAKANRVMNLKGIEWDIGEGWNTLNKHTGTDTYDFACLMKVVPVALRHSRSLTDVLFQTPAKFILITGSKTSMTKKTNIAKREKSVINNFIDHAGWTRVQEVETREESGWIVKTNYTT